MSSLVHSVGNMVEAGVKGLIGLAETYYTSEDEDASQNGNEKSNSNGNGHNGDRSSDDEEEKQVEPVPIRHDCSNTISSNTAYSTSSSTTSSSIVSKPINQGALVQILDVPSGWIHLQSTYLDGAGTRKVRSFGLKNLADKEVGVVVDSDLGNQILFWTADDDGKSSLFMLLGTDDSDEFIGI